jgi:hypothetical protein
MMLDHDVLGETLRLLVHARGDHAAQGIRDELATVDGRLAAFQGNPDTYPTGRKG